MNVRSEAIEHEPCVEDGHRVEKLDANGDGKPDIRRVLDAKTGKESCRISDLNHDDRPDLYEYFSDNGDLRRREADYDDNGAVESIELFENGKLVQKQLDTTGRKRLDTWDFYDPQTGKRVRRERDSRRGGQVDQWWTFDGPDGSRVTIVVDRRGEGHPDPADTIVLGGGGAPQASASPSTVDAGAPAPAAPAVDAGLPPAVPVATAASASPEAGTASIDAGADSGAHKKTSHGGKKK